MSRKKQLCERHIWEDVVVSQDTKKLKCKKCGKEKTVPFGKKEKQMIKDGDTVQPEDKDEFIETYGFHPDETYEQTERYLKKHPSKIKDKSKLKDEQTVKTQENRE